MQLLNEDVSRWCFLGNVSLSQKKGGKEHCKSKSIWFFMCHWELRAQVQSLQLWCLNSFLGLYSLNRMDLFPNIQKLHQECSGRCPVSSAVWCPPYLPSFFCSSGNSQRGKIDEQSYNFSLDFWFFLPFWKCKGGKWWWTNSFNYPVDQSCVFHMFAFNFYRPQNMKHCWGDTWGIYLTLERIWKPLLGLQ